MPEREYAWPTWLCMLRNCMGCGTSTNACGTKGPVTEPLGPYKLKLSSGYKITISWLLLGVRGAITLTHLVLRSLYTLKWKTCPGGLMDLGGFSFWRRLPALSRWDIEAKTWPPREATWKWKIRQRSEQHISLSSTSKFNRVRSWKPRRILSRIVLAVLLRFGNLLRIAENMSFPNCFDCGENWIAWNCLDHVCFRIALNSIGIANHLIHST